MTPPADDSLDALLRAYWADQDARLDPAPTLARIRSRRAPRRGRRMRWGAGLALAAGLAGVALLLPGPTPALASPEQVVRQARAVHAPPRDRCFRVEFQWPAAAGAAPAAARARQLRLWTRGRQFFGEVEGPLRTWYWGQDEGGGLWLALPPRQGLRFENREAPEWVQALVELARLEPPALFDALLTHYDLRLAEGPGLTVAATPRPDRPHADLGPARVDLDPATRELRRLVLSRQPPGRPGVQVTFTREDRPAPPPTAYQLEGHLQPPYRICSRQVEPQRRLGLLHRFFTPEGGKP